MKNADVINMLTDIDNYLNKEEYEKASNYIKRKKEEIKNDVDASSDYIDNLVKDLK